MDKKLFIQAIEIFVRCCTVIYIVICTGRNAEILERMASDGNTLYSNVYCRLSFDV